MPGGRNFRQWYAMRAAMQQRGTWTTTGRPHHIVPAQEEGEPPAQRPRYADTLAGLDVASNLPEASPDSATPESLPDLEQSPSAEGNG